MQGASPDDRRASMRRKSSFALVNDRREWSFVRPRPLQDLNIDETPGSPPVVDQLQKALKKHAGKVLTLFESWDADRV